MGARQSLFLHFVMILNLLAVGQSGFAQTPEAQKIPATLPLSQGYREFIKEKNDFEKDRLAGKNDFEKSKSKFAQEQKRNLEAYKKDKKKQGWQSADDGTAYHENIKELKAREKARRALLADYDKKNKKKSNKVTRPQVLAEMDEMGILEREPDRVQSARRLYAPGSKSKLGSSGTGSAPSFGGGGLTRPSFPSPADSFDGGGAPFEDDYVPPPPTPGGMGEYVEPELPPPPPPPPGDFDFDPDDGF